MKEHNDNENIESNYAPANCQLSIVNYQSILKNYWGYDDFRGIQREIIESISSGHDTLGLMPTGGGKSITFQVPALAMEGVCIVITPLIALMKDQVQQLRRRAIIADAIYSGRSHDDIIRILENCILGNTKLLYVSPERISTPIFQDKVRHMNVSFITVDEAHCISQWGYDFRPAYLNISELRRLKPEAPVLALTATATPQVMEDICEKLKRPTPLPLPAGRGAIASSADNTDSRTIASPPYREGLGVGLFNVFRMSFERKNLTYVVRKTEDKQAELLHILSRVKGSAIVYVRNRQRTKEISDFLNINLNAPDGSNALPGKKPSTYYHAGLDHAQRDEHQRLWQQNERRVIVATNAFGMGIDKPDVRMVIHIDSPDSVEAYFQEAGRAGRDGKQAYAVLLYNNNDATKLRRRINDTFPPRAYIKEVYEHLAYYLQVAAGSGEGRLFEFCLDEFCHRFHYFPVVADAALKLLEQAGYIEYIEEQDNAARVLFLVERDTLYRLTGNSPEEDNVITAMLRLYGGLFTDYGFIDESLVARQAGLTPPQTYQVLKLLSQKRIISFIPRKRTPYIRYIRRREDEEWIQIPKTIYEERLAVFKQRIEAMLDYATNDRVCRSRQLLRYFGETDTHDCGGCDVCREHRHNPSAADAIRQLLADSKRHHVAELRSLPFDSEDIDNALRRLVSEGHIETEECFITLHT